MSQAIFVHDGEVIDHTPTANLIAGEVVVLSGLVGVAKSPIPANVPGSLSVEGVFDVLKSSGGGPFAVGSLLYWDNVAKVATNTSAGNALLGKVVRQAVPGQTRVLIRLTQ